MTKHGDVYHTDKSQILTIFPSCEKVDAIESYVVDLSVAVRSTAAVLSEFAVQILNNIASSARRLQVSEISIVKDFYDNFSIKNATRAQRGTGVEFVFAADDPLPKDFINDLSNARFKEKINDLFSDQDILSSWQWDQDFSITNGKEMLSRVNGCFSLEIIVFEPKALEEADNRLLIHIQHALNRGRKTCVIRTVDSDVVVICTSYLEQFLEYDHDFELYIDFGTGSNRRWYFINDCYDTVGASTALGLLFFHAFSGCDSTASFFKHNKGQIMKTWASFPIQDELSDVFQQLSWQPTTATISRCLPLLEKFVCHFYGSSTASQLSQLRLDKFRAMTSNDLRELPPTSSSLKLHILRSCYQAGWVWGNTFSQNDCPNLSDMGWLVSENSIEVKWTDVSEVSFNLLNNLLNCCKCRTVSCKGCSCKRNNLNCLHLCGCKAECYT